MIDDTFLFSESGAKRIIDGTRLAETLQVTNPVGKTGPRVYRDWWPGVIVTEGPSGEADFLEGSKYWVKRVKEVIDEESTEIEFEVLDIEDPLYRHIVADNIAERFDDHVLSPGTLVQVRVARSIYDPI